MATLHQSVAMDPGRTSRMESRGVRIGIPWPVGLLLVLAAVLRVAMWAQQRSLWIDEARLALNVASRSYLELLPPLDYDQAAPLLFLWLQRSVVVLLGLNEASLRLLPLLAGIATVALAWPIGRRLFGDRVGLLATLLCASAPSLVSASSEAKQYGVEALVACAVLCAALRWLECPLVARRWQALLGLGMIGVWLAPSAVFVLAAAWLAVVLATEGRSRRRLHLAALAAVCWGGSSALAYMTVYRPAANTPYFRHYWESAFLTPGRPGVLVDGALALRAVLWGPVVRDSFAGSDDLGNVILIPAISVVLALIVVVGARRLVRSAGAPAGVLVLLPPTLTLLASVLGVYPISARTTMFFVPVLLTLFAAGLDEVSGRLKTPLVVRFTTLAPALLLLWATARELFSENPRENVRPLVGILHELREAGEPVYVFAGAIPAWAIYSTDWHSPDLKRLDYLKGIAQADGPAFENAPTWVGRVQGEANALVYHAATGVELYGTPTGLEVRVFGLMKARPDSGWSDYEARRILKAARPSIWLLFAHFYGPEGELLDELEAAGGRRTFQDMRNGAALIRYEFSS